MSHTSIAHFRKKGPDGVLGRFLFSVTFLLLFLCTPLQADEKRLGIVFSSTTAANFYDEFAYSQLFISLQGQARMAGIPFDLLSEEDMTDGAKLSTYDALVIPLMTHVQEANVAAIEAALDEAVLANGVGLVTAGSFLAFNENGSSLGGNSLLRLERYLGLTYSNSNNSVAMTLNASSITHPVMQDYQANEQIIAYEQIWLDSYTPLNGQSATTLATMMINNTSYNGVLATTVAGRNVHFANDQVFADSHLAWKAIQWVIFGDQTAVALKMGRMSNIFLGRNDMDQSMFAAQVPLVHVPLYDMLLDWKNQYDFIGSYYINIGNNPANGEYTDWLVSGPLYQDYMDMGNEIGTHSYTHPHYTSQLDATQLEFEFNQSKIEIEIALGITLDGTAIPGNPEGLAVDEIIDPYFEYISGQYGDIGSGYPLGIGQLRPDLQARYFGLNMSGDFSLIQFRGLTAEQAEQVWREEYLEQTRHSSQPIIHWLWHDYAPTIGASLGYNVAMIENTIAFAAANGSEFVTVQDMNNRIGSFEAASYAVSGVNPLQVEVAANGVGDFSLLIDDSQVISSVDAWYAYDDDQVFIPRDGGSFVIRLGAVQDALTHITSLPMHGELVSVSGNGVELDFSFVGKGEVKIKLNPVLISDYSVSGADAQSLQGNVLNLSFNTEATHVVAIRSGSSNLPPIATSQSVTTQQNAAKAIALQASDPEAALLSYTIVQQPAYGSLSGSGENITYTPNPDYLGVDSFSFKANDGSLDSNTATVTINVEEAAVNQAPSAQSESYQTNANLSVSISLKASDPEGDLLTYQVSQPANGLLSGSAPNLTYTPNAGFSGSDSFTFSVSDAALSSDLATININVLSGSSGEVSNAVDAISVDGVLDDWISLNAFPADADDVTGPENLIDWRQAWMAHSSTDLYIAYTNDLDISMSWGLAIYFDTDASILTGYNDGSALGIDYLLEGEHLYMYTGSGSDWSWQWLGQFPAAIQGQNAELAIPLSLLGNPAALRFHFVGRNAAYTGGSAEDFYPDGVYDAIAAQRYFEYSTAAAGANSAPVANGVTVSMQQDDALALTLEASDLDGDPLQYEIVAQPANGSLSNLSFPEAIYTPNPGFVGIDQFTFRVSDGVLQSELATVSITVSAIDAGTVSNEVLGMTVDGLLDDWIGLSPFPGDPDDVSGAENFIDWRQAWMAHSETDLFIAYTNDVNISLSWGLAIYLDTDASLATGFNNGTAIGADYVIEGEHLYQYTGTGTDWSWQWLGQLTIGVQGQNAEVIIPKSMLGNPTLLNVIFVGDNGAYAGGTAEDLYPDDIYNSTATLRYFEYDATSGSSVEATAIDQDPPAVNGVVAVVDDVIDNVIGKVGYWVNGIFNLIF